MASHIGKLPIEIPAGVEVTINGQEFAAKGAKGSDSYTIPEGVTAKVEGNEIIVTANDDLRPTRAKHGLARSIVASMVKGVHDGYSKSLDIVGTGYRAQMKGKGIEFSLGYSHTITVNPPEGITLELPNPNQVIVKGTDKQAVGQVAANIRKLRAPEPYKGKGIKYSDEVIRRKAGKAGKIFGKGKKAALKRRHARIRKRISGTAERPRLVVTRSNRHMVAQIVDDNAGKTLVSESTLMADFADFQGTKTEAAKKVGELLAKKAKDAGITTVVFDRGGNMYHGRVAAVAEGAREGGLAL